MDQPLVLRLLASTAAIAWIAAFASNQALSQSPQDPSLASGAASVARQGTTTIVTQSTDRAVLDWRSFSVGAGETVRFDQPGRSSVTLNRVTGGEISRLDGRISANGQVWLANPNGILIGSGGRIDVGGLLATTGRVDAAEFMRSGQALIDRISPDALIRNEGAVRIADGGYAALAAAALKNDGVIVARAGTIALAAGAAVTVDFMGDRLLQFQVTQPLAQAPAGADALIAGAGLASAEGGVVRMSARAAKGVIDSVINLKGQVIASDVRIEGGAVIFGDGGITQVGGRIDASNATGKGGQVAILGEKVGLMDGASVDASGSFGGGTVLVGGDWQGKGPSPNATIAYVAPTASINVDATMIGDGGKAVVWADDATRFNGTIRARGGVLAGNGGQVETSGKRALNVGDAAVVTTNARAPTGRAGAWLLDPNDITIGASNANISGSSPFQALGAGASTVSVATISAALGTGDVTIQTSAGTGGNGDITFSAGTIAHSGGAARTLTLKADRDVIVSAGATITLSGAAHNVVLNAGAGYVTQASVVGGIRIDGAVVTTGGSIALVGGQGGSLSAQGSTVTKHGVQISGGALDAGSGSILLRGVGRPGDTSANVHGVFLSGGSLSALGGIDVTGVGGTAASGAARGVLIVNTKFTSGGGLLKIAGTGLGAGSDRAGVRIENDASSTISFGTGGVTIDGTSSATGSSTRGVELLGGTISGSGAILIEGQGGGSSGSNTTAGFFMGTGVYLRSTATGAAITLAGDRGLGDGRSANLAGGVIETTVGDIIVSGASPTGSGSNLTGVSVDNDMVLKTVDGAIKLTGSAGPGSGNDGVAVLGTITATGGGSVSLIGDGSNGGAGVNFSTGLVSTNSGDLTIRGDSFASSSSSVSSASGKIRVEPFLATDNVDLFGTATPGAGVVQMTPAFLASMAGDLVVGRSDQTGAINVAAGATLPANLLIKSGTGAVNFLGALTPGAADRTLAVETGGSVSFAGTIGATTALKSFSVTAAETRFAAVSIVTTGSQSVAGAVTLVGSPSFTTTNSPVVFSGAVNASTTGGQTLSVTLGTGTLSLAGGAGAATPLSTLSIPRAALSGVIRTQGQQSYTFATVATAATLSTNNAGIQFGAGLNGPGDVTLKNGDGTISFLSAVGAATPLASLTQQGDGPLRTTGSIKTTGSQAYAGPIQMATSTTFSTTGGSLLFQNSVDATAVFSPSELGIAAGTGSVSFAGVVGGNFKVGALTQSGTGVVTIDAAVNSAGLQSYAGSVLVGAGASFSADDANLTFMGSVDATGGGVSPSLSVGSGTVSLAGGVGATTPFDALTISGAAALGGTIKTTGAQNYGGSVSLLSATTLSTNDADILFADKVRGPGGLTLAAGSGEVSFADAVGTPTPLAGVSSKGSGTLTTGGNITTTGAQSYAGSVLLGASTTFATTNSAISFQNGINAKDAAIPADLTFSAGSGAVSLGGALGAATPLSMIVQLGSGSLSLGGTAASTGIQSYAGSVVLTSDATFSANDANVIFAGSLNAASPGGQSLTASLGTGTLNLLGGVGGGSALSSLSVGGATAIGGGGVDTSGSQSYGGAVTLTADAALSSSGQPIVFGGAVDGAYAFTVSGTSVSFAGAVGGGTTLQSVSVVTTGGGLALPAVNATDLSLTVGGGTVTQNGAITASKLELLTTSATYSLTNTDNAISTLAANLDALTLVNGPLASLTIGSVGSTSGVTAAGSISITQLSAAQSIEVAQQLKASNAAISLTSGSTIAGSGLITAASLALSAVSGTLQVASGVPISATAGSFVINGAPFVVASPVTPPPVQAPPVAVTSQTQPVTSVVQAPPVQAPAVQAPTIVAEPPPAPVSATLTAASDPTRAPFADPRLNDLSVILVAARPIESRPDPTIGVQGDFRASLAEGRSLTLRTPPSVSETGARLASSPTVALDPADTGGAGGQVIAAGLDILAAAGKRVILPGLLSIDPELVRRSQFRDDLRNLEVPEINEEPLMD